MATTAAASAREILTGLHEIMAKRGSAQAKLDRVVDLIAAAMGSDVCSIYLLRDNVLELYATHGLRKEAVHVTRLRMGEGLVGTIAEGRILNLAEAAQHPAFAYRPETGEERFHSFAGVPIVRLESPIGVLAVQHADPRRYEDVEIEALQTVAMVLSEMIAGARLVDGARRSRIRSAGPLRLTGLGLVAGMAKGVAVFHEPRIVVEHTVAEDIEAERDRVYAAFRKMREQIDNMARDAEFGTVGEHQEILETYRMFAYDEGWSRRINAAIDSGLTAEAAIERVQQRTRARMREIDDPLLQERMHDLEDLSNRLLRIVSGRLGTAQTGLTHDAVLIARNLGPAELLEYDRRRLKAVVLEEGSLTSHMTIVARAIGIPVIGRLADIRHSVEEGESILVDGDNGSVIIRPNRPLLTGFEQRMAMSQKRQAEFAAIRTLPARTRDGVDVSVMVNAGLAEDAAALAMSGGDGIGLFRTEFQFLVSATLPGRERQQRLYTKVLEEVGDKPVVFRTVDIGGDKALPYLRDEAQEQAENPAMGWRALRLSLGRSTLMRAQARALVEASGGRVLRVMFPMISEPWEYEEARALFEEQVDWARKAHRKLPARIEYGAMLEVPSLAEMLDQLLPRVDFISIGTNDLTQFLFAADRSDPRLAQRYDWLSPAILRFLKRVLDGARAAGVPARVCGEMAGRPLEAMALIGIGAESFSITPAGVGPVKAMVRSLDAAAVRSKLDQLLVRPPKDTRKVLTEWARRHRVIID
jgi:phosphotransferase system, enzyme I, PtsP